MAQARPIIPGSDDATNLLSGTVAGRFLIQERLGKGGMGEVYRAEDLKLKRTVALKRLAPALRADSLYRKQFQQEAERVSRFSDPHIAAVHDVVEDQGEMFLVMEFVEGENLRTRLCRPISLEQFLEIATQCAEALITAHDRGLVHRDIKPENIMLTPGGRVKVLDFGLARHLPRSDQSSTIDRAGTMAGTPAYMSPEVLLERVPDERADVFSLGVVFYEILTGQHPFISSSFVVTSDRIRNETPAPIRIFNSQAPETLEVLISRIMAKDPSQRCSSRELLDALRAIQSGVSPSGLALVLPPPSSMRRKRGRTWLIPAATAVVLLLTIFALWAVRFRHISSLGNPATPVQLAVLPFMPTTDDPGLKAFGSGLTQTLAAKLTQLSGTYPLQVVPASEVQAEGVSSVEQARKDFGVNLVVEGSLHSSGNQVRVTYSLVDAHTRRQLHAGAVDAGLADALTMEDSVVTGVLDMLGLRVQASERVVLAAHGTGDPTAYEQYLRGRGYLLDYHKPENIDNAISSFNRALSLDPKYARAYAALGEAYWQGYQEGQHGSEWMTKASDACQQAATLEPGLAEGYACLGRVYLGTGEYEKAAAQFQKATSPNATSDDAFRGLATAYQKLNKPDQAEATYRRAISLRPQYWSGYSWLGTFYWQQGRYNDAIKTFQEVTTLSPDNYRGYSNLGGIYVLQGQYQQAIAVLEKSVALRPTVEAYDNLGNAYFSMRKFDESARNFEQGLKFDKTSWLSWGNLADAYYWVPGKRPEAANAYREAVRLAGDKLRVNSRDGRILAYRATYLAMLEKKSEALASLQHALQLSPADPDVMLRAALVYNHFKDTDRTLDWLQKTLAAGVPAASIRSTPDFDHLSDNARFQTMVRGR